MKIHRNCLLIAFFIVTISTNGNTFDNKQLATISLSFGDYLIKENEYYRAITEYQRALFLLDSTDTEKRIHAIRGIGSALYRGGEFHRSARWLEKHYPTLTNSANNEWWELLLYSYLKSGNIDSGIALINRDNVVEPEFYSGVAYAFQSKWHNALLSFQKIARRERHYDKAIFNATICRNAIQEDYRNPTVAGVLAIVPGAGYYYAGHKKVSIFAFVFNSILIYSTVESFEKDHNFLGGLLSFISITWYSGSIYGSISSAKRYNNRITNRYLDKLAL